MLVILNSCKEPYFEQSAKFLFGEQNVIDLDTYEI